MRDYELTDPYNHKEWALFAILILFTGMVAFGIASQHRLIRDAQTADLRRVERENTRKRLAATAVEIFGDSDIELPMPEFKGTLNSIVEPSSEASAPYRYDHVAGDPN